MPTMNCYLRNGQLRDPDFNPFSSNIRNIPSLVGCIEYQYNSLEDKVDKSAVATSYRVGWINYTLQDILDQKF